MLHWDRRFSINWKALACLELGCTYIEDPMVNVVWRHRAHHFHGSKEFICNAPSEVGFSSKVILELKFAIVTNLSLGEAPSLCRFAVPGEQAQISGLIAAPKSRPISESPLGLQPARDTCRVYR